MHYQYINTGGETITFIPGLGQNYSIFNLQAGFLRGRGYSTIAVDPLGQGYSNSRNRLSIPDQAASLDGILESEGIANTHLIGFSMGAAIALEYCHQHRERVGRLCLINPAFYRKDLFSWRCKMLLPLLPLFPLAARLDCLPRSGKADLSSAFFSTAHYSLPNSLRVTKVKGLWKNILAFMDHGVPEYTGAISKETLIIRSEHDELLTPATAAWLRENLPHSQLEIIGGNHVIMLSNGGKLNELLGKFFTQLQTSCNFK